jgi:hypothetical protein
MSTEQAYINGFLKRASEHGFSQNEAVELYKRAFGEEDGPYRQEQAARMVAEEQLLRALAHNKENNPGHYYLNPFVGGPLTELASRIQRRYHAGSAGEHGGALNLLGGPVGPIANAVIGGANKRDAHRRMYEEYAGKESPE